MINLPHHRFFSRVSRFQLLLMTAIPLVLGFVFQWFFYEYRLGLNMPIAIALGLIGFFIVFKRRLLHREWFGWFILATALLLSLVFSIWTSEPVQALNFLLMPLMLFTGIFLLSGWASRSWDDFAFIEEFFPRAFVSFLASLPLPFHGLRHLRGTPKDEKKPIFTGIMLSIPILIMAALLLASGDAVFSHSISFITEGFKDYGEVASRSALFILSSIFISALAYMLMREPNESRKPAAQLKKNASVYLSTPTLVMLNLLYLFFLFIQFKYLLGGADLSFLENLTYAEYARRGFAELLVAAGLNFILVSAFSAATLFESKMQAIVFRGLASITVVLTFLMLISSHLRLGYYIDAYGFTYTRFFVQSFLLVLGAFLLFLLLKVWHEGFALKKAMILLSLSAWILVSFCNIDQRILNRNLALYTEQGRIDYGYLIQNLSFDVLPQTIDRMKQDGFDTVKKEAGQTWICKDDLCHRIPQPKQADSWQEINLASDHAHQYLAEQGLLSSNRSN